ncbi:hypothetical protein BDN72DRAFT_900101 [Pluteus cervinus]|uniref:Uncharacterized protein n=1 Tax=Pluteus cervinus TaxID=181527 RepID=A0ACD3AK98_9AGAR|nr:hypothetical protein BDN72DRAFT_900101 [Pluteus cervinus]
MAVEDSRFNDEESDNPGTKNGKANLVVPVNSSLSLGPQNVGLCSLPRTSFFVSVYSLLPSSPYISNDHQNSPHHWTVSLHREFSHKFDLLCSKLPKNRRICHARLDDGNSKYWMLDGVETGNGIGDRQAQDIGGVICTNTTFVINKHRPPIAISLHDTAFNPPNIIRKPSPSVTTLLPTLSPSTVTPTFFAWTVAMATAAPGVTTHDHRRTFGFNYP